MLLPLLIYKNIYNKKIVCDYYDFNYTLYLNYTLYYKSKLIYI